MDTDFPTSPAKRQRTETPEPAVTDVGVEVGTLNAVSEALTNTEPVLHTTMPNDQDEDINKNKEHELSAGSSLLDVLMQQVEAESDPVAQPPTLDTHEKSDGQLSALPEDDKPQPISAVNSLETTRNGENTTQSTPIVLDPAPATSLEATASKPNAEEQSQEQEETYTNSQLDDKASQKEEKQVLVADVNSVQIEPTTNTKAVLNQQTITPVENHARPSPEQNEDILMTSAADVPDETGKLTAGKAGQLPPTELQTVVDDGEAALPGREIVEANNNSNPDGPEWEVDSSPYESSSDSDSSDTTDSDEDDSDEDADGDYAMLGPEEQARILMQGDGGSDDEGGPSRAKGEGAALRTANEKEEEIIPLPDITVTEEMKIEELGNVEATVESTILIKAKTTGVYQVLENGSLLCLADRKVIGLVAETLGRVEQPLYTVRFTNDKAIEEMGLAEKGTVVYYVVPHSTFVFTQPLKAVKGSDASNFHDEEVGDDEMEFSDDEAEAEHKRQLKLKRQNRRDDGATRGRGGRGGPRFRGNRQGSVVSTSAHSEANGSTADGVLNYDDNAGDDDYTPLARPSNLHEMMGQNEPRETTSTNHLPLPPPPPQPQQSNRGRGNHQNFRGRGGRGNQRGRGGFNQQNNRQNGSNNEWQNRPFMGQPPQPQQQYGMPPPPPQFQYPPQQLHHHQQQQYQYPQQYQQSPYPPQLPALVPQTMPYSTPISPSPMSPLPKSQYNFGNYSNQGFQGGAPQHQHQYPNQYQQHHQQPPPPPGQYAPQSPIPGLNMTGGNGPNNYRNFNNNNGYNNGQNNGQSQ